MSLTKVTYSMIDAPVLNIKDYGAVGDGVANDTAAWLAFKSACATLGAKGVIPTGTYLVDPFTLGPSDSGLILEGPTQNFASGAFGAPTATLKARSASAKFVSFQGVYNLNISGLAFDGGQYSDNVFYFDGTVNNTYLKFSFCEFYGATNATGVVHRYDGTIGGDHCYFYNCLLYQYHNYTAGTNRARNCIRNTNTNAFIIDYTDCFFAQADTLIEYQNGSCNLYGCMGFLAVSTQIKIINICQPFICSYWYNEQTTNVPFILQQFNAGVTSGYPITIINPIVNSINAGITLTCQQPVTIYGGFIGGNITVTPVATYGLMNHIFDSVAFNTGYGIIGTGAETQVSSRNCSVNFVQQAAQFQDVNLQNVYASGSTRISTTYTITNGGATPAVTGSAFVKLVNSAPQNVTTLIGSTGQIIQIYFDDANTTLVNSGDFILTASANVTPTANSIITMTKINSNQWVEVSRSIK